MARKALVLFLVCITFFCFVSCMEDNSFNKNDAQESSGENSMGDDGDLFDSSVFKTEDIKRITFYGYYGAGTPSDVPKDHMTEIIKWIKSFTFGEKADIPLPPGTNTHFIEIEYNDGTVIKEGLDAIERNGIVRYVNTGKKPDCYDEIIAKSNLN